MNKETKAAERRKRKEREKEKKARRRLQRRIARDVPLRYMTGQPPKKESRELRDLELHKRIGPAMPVDDAEEWRW